MNFPLYSIKFNLKQNLLFKSTINMRSDEKILLKVSLFLLCIIALAACQQTQQSNNSFLKAQLLPEYCQETPDCRLEDNIPDGICHFDPGGECPDPDCVGECIQNEAICGNNVCEIGENSENCPTDCPGDGGQCSDPDIEQICNLFNIIPFPDCQSALEGRSDTLDNTCATARDICVGYDDPSGIFCEDLYTQCLNSGLCDGGGQVGCGDGVCDKTTESPLSCQRDCGNPYRC